MPNDIVDIILVLRECHCNNQQAVELYHDRFCGRQYPNDRTIARLVSCQQQQFKNDKNVVLISERNDPQVVAILAMTVNSHVSTRQIQKKLGIPKSTTHRISVTHNFHSYHIALSKDLTPDDFCRRLVFCNWAQTILQRDRTFFRYVSFSEATFHNCPTEST